MATQLNPNLILQSQSTVPLNSLAGMYSDAAAIRQHQLQADQVQQALQQREMQNKAYAAATGPDGKIDNNKLIAFMAQNQGGSAIPGVQKTMLDNQKAQAEINDKNSTIDKNSQSMLHDSLKLLDNSIASLAARPDVNDQMVYGEVGRLVNAGVFNMQAKQQGTDPDTYAKNLLSTMPVGNPQALKSWLVQQGSRVADASKRLEMMVPKYNEQDQGGVINQGTVDPMTGQRTAGQNVVKTASPDTLANNAVAIRGQNMTDFRQGEANDVNRQAARSQIMETAGGLVSVDKGRNVATPVTGPNGPVYSAESTASKNNQMASRLLAQVADARTAVKDGATASGIGAARDKVTDYLGIETKASNAATKLEALAGWMTSNVPRFEGPQSDRDTETYRTMAGMVGDRTKPMSQRLAALDVVEKLMKDYQLGGPGGTPMPAATAVPYSGPERRGSGTAPAGRPSLDSFFRR